MYVYLKKMKYVLKITLLIWLIIPTIFHASADPEYIIESKWLKNPVAVDGDVSSSSEWSDANKIELTIGTNYGRSPPFHEVTIWAKNNADNLYLLLCIKFDYTNYDLQDTAYIYYLIPDQVSGLVFSDKSETSQLGSTWDYNDKTGPDWTNDLDAAGENNVEGMGHFDGLFYWFEIKKPLNSGDGLDWIFLHGETYGYADSPIDKDEHLCIGLYDDSEGYDLQAFIQLEINGPDQTQIQAVGGTVEDVPVNLVLRSMLTRIGIYLSIIIVSAWLYMKKR